MTTGALVVAGKKNVQVKFTNRKGKVVTMPIADAELSQELAERKRTTIESLAGVAVDLEEVEGRPTKVREQGKPWCELQRTAAPGSGRVERDRNLQPQRNQSNPPPPGDFHNPYNFVPALPRNHLTSDHPLGDGAPMGHGAYEKDHWSGTIAVNLTTVTPLLIPDAAKATGEEGEHRTFPIRKGSDGRPYLPATSIKGMLRSAYEAITNSRLSVFEKHDDRLFYRMSALDGLSLIPAVVEGERIRLMPGTTSTIPQWNGQRWNVPIMYAAWLPQYHRDSRNNVSYSNMRHGDHVRVWLEQYQKLNREGKTIFKYWKVRDIVPFHMTLSAKPEKSREGRWHTPVPQEDIISAEGYLCITKRNIERKHDERVFFRIEDNQLRHEESCSQLSADWEYLIKNYQAIHEGEEREAGYDWSRQIVGGVRETRLSQRDNEQPTLCYAFVKRTSSGLKIDRLYPVMISRAIFDYTPEALLHPELQPARDIKKLSPSDRIFGWVNQKGKGAYKGQLRIGPVACNSEGAIEDLTQHEAWRSTKGMPLAILGEPKPQQVRFYAAANSDGTPLDKGEPKSVAYSNPKKQGLRGRKVYLHHQLPADYWNPASKELRVGDRYREYLHPKYEQTTQNRTIKAWVKQRTSFSFKIHIMNLSNVELGALLWLLDLTSKHPDHYHRLGGGKPLGFGSVELAIIPEESNICQGHQWENYYQSLTLKQELQSLNAQTVQSLIQEFETALKSGYKSDRPSFIQAFLKAAKGFEKPIHTPRTTPNPSETEESFQWFVENEREGRNGGCKLSLPELVHDQGLPFHPIR